jgi:hypothetical protein
METSVYGHCDRSLLWQQSMGNELPCCAALVREWITGDALDKIDLLIA